jgi:hypothetical protein
MASDKGVSFTSALPIVRREHRPRAACLLSKCFLATQPSEGHSGPVRSVLVALGSSRQSSPVAVERKLKESNLMMLPRVTALTPADADELAIGVKKVT